MSDEVTWVQAVGGWHKRKFDDQDSTEEDPDREYSKDYDRVLYSTAFRRLGGVTQVAASSEIALFHNRLTHALKTAQVGSRIANHLINLYSPKAARGLRLGVYNYGAIEPRVVRAACLALNLGRPPFGYTAVQELQEITASVYHDRDKFSETAQAFRIVTKLAFREAPGATGDLPGLNLSRGTLLAMLKYPWRYGNAPSDARDGSTRWGYYKSEEDIVAWAAGNELHAPGRTIDHHGRRQSEYRSVEAQILDWADDISYAIHDVEDFYRVGLVPLHHLVSSKDEWQSFFDYTWDRKLSKLFGEDESALWALGRHVINETFPKEQYEGTQADRIALHGFASNLIKDATDGTKVTTEGIITIEDQQLAKIELLKQLTWYYVLERPSLETLRRGQRALIRSLYDHLVDWVREVWDGEPLPPPKYGRNRSRRRGPHLPSRLTEYLNVSKFSDPEPEDALDSSDVETQLITRAVVDYIASLTELQAVELNARLSGQSSNSMLDSWFLS